MSFSEALTNDELAVLRHPSISHSVKPYLSIVPSTILAAARINQAVFPERVAELTIDTLSGSWAKAKPGMTVWIGTSAGAYDVGIYRVRAAQSGSTLKIEEMNSGDPGLASLLNAKALADNQHISLMNDCNLHAIKSRIDFDGSNNGTFYKDFDQSYVTQNQNAVPCFLNLGEHRAGWVNSSNVLELDFTADAITFLPGDTVLSYFWDVDGATITVGTTGSQNITVEFGTGHYLVWCTVGLSNGATVRACRHVFAHKWGVYDPYRVNVSSIRNSLTGTTVSLTLEPTVKMGNTPILSGTLCLLWEETRWSDDVPSAFSRAPLWLQTASGVTTIRKMTTTTFDLHSTAQMVAVGQFLDSVSSPTTWQEAVPALMHLEFWCFYLLHYHSTALMLHDTLFQDVRDYTFVAISESPGGLFDQVQRGLHRMNMHFNQRHDGTLVFTRHPFIESTGDRNVRPERMTLTEADIVEISISRRNRAKVGKVELYGFIAGTSPLPVRTIAFGSTGGQGMEEPRIQDQLVLSQSELNERAGMIFAMNNSPYERVTLKMARNWAAVIEPSEMYFVRVTVSETIWPEGTAFNQRCIVREVTKTFRARGAVETTITIEPETSGPPGRTMPIHLGNGAEDVSAGIEFNDFGLPIFTIDPFGAPSWSPWPEPDAEYNPVNPEEPSLIGVILMAWASDGIGYTLNADVAEWVEKLDGDVKSVVAAVDTNSDDVRLYILMEDEKLYYAAGSIGSLPSLQQTLGGENNLLRIARGVADSVAIGGVDEASAGAWEVTLDLTDEMYDFDLPTADTDDPYFHLKIKNGTWGEWIDTVGVEARVGSSAAGQWLKRAQVDHRKLEPFTLTEVSAVYDFSGGTNGPYIAIGRVTDGAEVYLTTINNPSATDGTISWMGSVANVTGVGITAQTANTTTEGSADVGTARIKSITIKGTGFNPFEDKQLVTYSSDNGLSETVSQFGIRGQETAFDTDDFGLGVFIAASNRRIWNSTGYTADDFDHLTHIPYMIPRFGIRITCVRIPYRKLATQALNNSETSLQFIYGTDGVIENPSEDNREETLWGVNFNASTRDPESIVVSNMTPVIEDVTYYVIGPDALETAGANTQHILALCKPIGGGDTVLIHSTNGATTWQLLLTFDGTWVTWIPGSTTRALVGGAEGVGYVDIESETLQDVTGDFVSEVSSLPLRGVIQIEAA